MKKSYNKVDYSVIKNNKIVNSAWCYEYQLEGLKDMLASHNLKIEILI